MGVSSLLGGSQVVFKWLTGGDDPNFTLLTYDFPEPFEPIDTIELFELVEPSPKKAIIHTHGELAEWSNAAVLKTVDLQGSGGSNPSLSAIPPHVRRKNWCR